MKETKLLENFKLLYLYDFNIKNTSILNDYPYISVFFIENNPVYYENITKAYTLMIGYFDEKIRINKEGNDRPFYTKFIKTVKVLFKNQRDQLSSAVLFSNLFYNNRVVYSYSENKFLVFEIKNSAGSTFWEWIQNINYDILAEYILKLRNEDYFLHRY